MGFVANITGARSHGLIADGLHVLQSMVHRGGVAADPEIGDGAGCLIQIPDALLRAWSEAQDVVLPPAGDYAVATCFLPRDPAARDFAKARLERFVSLEEQHLIGWREVPINPDILGERARESIPTLFHAIIGRGDKVADQAMFDRKLLTIRKQTLNPLATLATERKLPGLNEFYIASMSSRTLVYKGMLQPSQLGSFYRDLADPSRYVERFIVTSWADYLHQRARATLADQRIEAHLRTFLLEGESVSMQHYIAER